MKRNALQHRKDARPKKAAKHSVGKYVCYGEEDGSFSWGRIVDEGVVNTPKGEKEVFILEDRTTCRVPKSELEMESVRRIGAAIGPGGTRHFLPSPATPELLPDKFPEPKSSGGSLPCGPPERSSELDGVVPDLGKIMGWERSKMGCGTPMSEMVRTIKSSEDPTRDITFLVRCYGYRTNVRKERINIAVMQDGGDIVDKHSLGLGKLSDDELFLCVMSRRAEGVPLNQGMKNILQITPSIDGSTNEATPLDMAVSDMAASEPKKRIAEEMEETGVKVIDAEALEDSEQDLAGEAQKAAKSWKAWNPEKRKKRFGFW